jgi:hypothetical protein
MKTTLVVALTGIVVSAVTALVVTSYKRISNKIAEPAAALSVTASIDHMDQNYTVVFAGKYALTPWQVTHSSSAEAISANVNTLVRQFVQAGALYPRAATVTVRIVNVRDETVRITGVRLVELRRLRPLGGTLINMPSQGGVNTMQMAFNLDEVGSPVAHRIDSGGGVGASFFTHNEIELKHNETVTLKLLVATGKYSASFKVGVDYTPSGGKSTKTKLIDQGGKPFRLTAYSCSNSGRLRYQRLYGLETPEGWRLHEVTSLQTYDSDYCNFDFQRSVLLWTQG